MSGPVGISADRPDERAALAASGMPGLAALLRLDGVGPTQLSRRGLLDVLVALERTKAWVEARQQHLLDALATETACAADRASPGAKIADQLDREWVREEVACALRVAAPTAAVARRPRRIRFPTFNRRAERCDLDHAVPWQDGGTTSAANLHALCARHHHAKHDAGWRALRHQDNSTEWIDPTGHRFVKPAEAQPLDTTFSGQRPLRHGPPTGSGPPRGV